MKYYSEILNKMYDNQEDLIEAEAIFNKKKADAEAAKKAAELNISKRKKELANNIDKATKALEDAENALEAAKLEAQKILEDSNKKVLDILNPAKEAVKEARQSKFKAIANFNKEFGVYTTSISNEQLNKEFKHEDKGLLDFFYLLNSML